MTLLSLAQDACDLVGIPRPSSVASSADVGYAQMRAIAQQALNDIAQRHDWRALYGFQNVASDGAALPADYARMASAANVDRLNVKALLAGTISTSNLLVDPESVERDGYDACRLIDGSYVYPNGAALGNASIRVYIRNTAIRTPSGGVAERWANDNDTPLLPESLILLGMVWRWKSAKGFAYAEDLSNHEREFERLSSADAALGTLVVAHDRFLFPDPYTSAPMPSGPFISSMSLKSSAI